MCIRDRGTTHQPGVAARCVPSGGGGPASVLSRWGWRRASPPAPVLDMIGWGFHLLIPPGSAAQDLIGADASPERPHAHHTLLLLLPLLLTFLSPRSRWPHHSDPPQPRVTLLSPPQPQPHRGSHPHLHLTFFNGQLNIPVLTRPWLTTILSPQGLWLHHSDDPQPRATFLTTTERGHPLASCARPDPI